MNTYFSRIASLMNNGKGRSSTLLYSLSPFEGPPPDPSHCRVVMRGTSEEENLVDLVLVFARSECAEKRRQGGGIVEQDRKEEKEEEDKVRQRKRVK